MNILYTKSPLIVCVGLLCSILVSACGDRAQEGPKDQKVTATDAQPVHIPQLTYKKSGEPISLPPQNIRIVHREGGLPANMPAQNVMYVQTEVMDMFANGVGAAVFPDTLSAPSQMLVEFQTNTPKGWEEGPNGKRLYLVKRHLKPIAQDKRKSDIAAFCGTDRIYSGYVAARPYTRQFVKQEKVLEVMANPYGVLICQEDKQMRYKLIPSNQVKTL